MFAVPGGGGASSPIAHGEDRPSLSQGLLLRTL